MSTFLLNTRATRTAISSALLLLAASLPAQAQPFLVCDPPGVEEGVTHYKINGFGNEIMLGVDPTGEHGFVYELTALPTGSHTVTAKACNQWGCGDDSDPFEFRRPPRPVKSVGVGIIFTD